VTLAEHLTGKEILSRDRRYEVSGAALDRWPEPLESNITSVLAENLSALIAPDTIINSGKHPGLMDHFWNQINT